MKQQKKTLHQTSLLLVRNTASLLRSANLCSVNLCSVIFILLISSACNDAFEKDVRLGVLPEDAAGDGGSGGGSGNGDAPPDDDDDGLSNEVEGTFGISPTKADSDHDSFNDGLEFVGLRGDPLDASANPIADGVAVILTPSEARTSDPDSDQDGLGDAYEKEKSLDADNPDTDGDGYSDGLELVAGSNPFLSSDRPTRQTAPVSDGIARNGPAPADSDRDGLADDIEEFNGTSADSRDTDTDGFSDGIEFLAGSDGSNVLSVPGFVVPERPETETEETQE